MLQISLLSRGGIAAIHSLFYRPSYYGNDSISESYPKQTDRLGYKSRDINNNNIIYGWFSYCTLKYMQSLKSLKIKTYVSILLYLIHYHDYAYANLVLFFIKVFGTSDLAMDCAVQHVGACFLSMALFQYMCHKSRDDTVFGSIAVSKALVDSNFLYNKLHWLCLL